MTSAIAPEPVTRREPNNTLAVKAASSFGWNISGAGLRAAAGFGLNLLLARLLGPEPFGLVALAMVVIALGNLFVDSGLGVQLIQKKDVTRTDIQTTFALQLILGATIALGLIFCSPLIALAFRQPQMDAIIRVLALVLVIQSAGQTSIALLRRDLRFKRLQQIQIVSYLFGYGIVGVPLAFMGAGVWTLVSAQLAQAALSTMASWLLVRHSLFPRLGPDVRMFLGFGSRVAGSNAACWIIGSLPSIIIGRSLGIASLGFYNRAYMLVSVPLTTLASSFQSVSLSIYSRLQDKHQTVRKAFLAIIALVSLVAFPCFLVVAAIASTVVQILLGPRWSSTAPLLVPLAVAMTFDAIAAMSGPLLISRGRPGIEFRIQLVAAVIGGLLVFYVSSMGCSLITVSWVVCLSFYLVRAVVASVLVKRELRFQWRELGSSLRGSILLGIATYVAARLLDYQSGVWHINAILRLLIAGGGAVALSVLSILFIPKAILHHDLGWLLLDRGLPVPRVIRRVLLELTPSTT